MYAPFDALVDGGGVFRASALGLLAENIVAVSSLTKSYGLGPDRIGWMLGPRAIIARADDAVTACYGALPAAHGNLAAHAFGRIGALADRARRLLDGKRARVGAWVASMSADGVTWSDPAEGLFGLVTLPGRADITAMIETAARDRDVLVAAGIVLRRTERLPSSVVRTRRLPRRGARTLDGGASNAPRPELKPLA